MALNFPSSPISGQTYQNGNSPYYIFNGNHWEIDKTHTINGTSGTSGSSGSSGSSGLSGTSGTSGSSGSSGSSGLSGSNGSSGTSGATGTSGSSGTSGTSGTSPVGYAITGSNVFNGNQTVTGSLTTTDNVIIGTSIGDEGGELHLALAATNNNLTGSVNIDVWRNRLRLWEGGGNARGVHIDLTKAPDGVGGELLWKTSAIVNAGTFIQMDNLKVSVTTGGNRGLCVAGVSTSFVCNISGWYGLNGGGNGYSAANITYTTSASLSPFGWNFVTEGDTAQYNILDKTNNKFYRITMMIGSAYNNNFISIERLY